MPESTSPNFYELYGNAIEAMHTQGISSDELDPNVVILASNPPRVVHEASSQAIVNQFGEELVAARDLTAPLSPITQIAREHAAALEDTTRELTMPARRRYFAGSVAAGVTVASLFLVSTGSAKYSINNANSSVTDPAVGNELLADNSLIYDESILPGDMGENVPFVRVVREFVPGVPDFADIEVALPPEKKPEIKQDTIPGEAVVALPLTVALVYGGAITYGSALRGSARRQARKVARKAGFSL